MLNNCVDTTFQLASGNKRLRLQHMKALYLKRTTLPGYILKKCERDDLLTAVCLAMQALHILGYCPQLPCSALQILLIDNVVLWFLLSGGWLPARRNAHPAMQPSPYSALKGGEIATLHWILIIRDW